MINLLCNENLFINNEKYLSSLLNVYQFFSLIIIKKDENIVKYIKDNNIIYSNNVILNIITENFVKELNEIDNITYILNTEIIKETDDYSYLSKYNNIVIIDYSVSNKFILQKENIKIYHLPYQVLDENIFNYDKTLDIAITDLNSDSNVRIFNELKKYKVNINNIDDYDNYNSFLAKHKIIIINNDIKNNGMNIDTLIELCILNKIIIINNKSSFIYNSYIKKYIIELQDNLIPSYVKYLLENYYDIYDLLYKDIDIEVYRKYIKNVGLSTIHNILTNNRYGFIMIRHVNSELSNKYWIESYKCIRKYYNNKIVIIDDNSNEDFLSRDIGMVNYEIIKSEFPQRGEILAYYYLHKNHLFDKAVIIHDSTFINNYIDFFKIKNIKFIWHFTHQWDNEREELKLMNKIRYNNTILNLYNDKTKWYGIFGLQSVIEYKFLDKLSEKYQLFNLLEHITNRPKRMNLERIFGLFCTFEETELKNNPSIFGIIHHYIHWGYTYNSYIVDKEVDKKLDNLDIIKVWSGR